jgi:hypothetical protein
MIVPNIAQDSRSMLRDFGEAVTLASRTVVVGVPSVASVEDTMLAGGIVAGQSWVLRLATADVPDLAPSSSTLTFRGRLWGIIHIQFTGAGNFTRAFLGAP